MLYYTMLCFYIDVDCFIRVRSEQARVCKTFTQMKNKLNCSFEF